MQRTAPQRPERGRSSCVQIAVKPTVRLALHPFPNGSPWNVWLECSTGNVMVERMECTKCGLRERVAGQRWCLECRAEWMRLHRQPLTGEARKRANARSYAKVYLKRGKLSVRPCVVCGGPGEEMHHDNYDRPLVVKWYCRRHHVEHHQGNRDIQRAALPTGLIESKGS